MKAYLTIYGIELLCHFEQDEIDQFDPQSGHYTIPGKYSLIDAEHAGESIFDILDDVAIIQLERQYNAEHKNQG